MFFQIKLITSYFLILNNMGKLENILFHPLLYYFCLLTLNKSERLICLRIVGGYMNNNRFFVTHALAELWLT